MERDTVKAARMATAKIIVVVLLVGRSEFWLVFFLSAGRSECWLFFGSWETCSVEKRWSAKIMNEKKKTFAGGIFPFWAIDQGRDWCGRIVGAAPRLIKRSIMVEIGALSRNDPRQTWRAVANVERVPFESWMRV
jgi:hypothetical protein